MEHLPQVTRRNVLKATGGAGAAAMGGLGLLAASAPAAALDTTFDGGGPVLITDDQGNVTEVYINPHSRVEWTGFDEEVVKVRQLLEARLTDGQSVLSPTLAEIDGGTPGTADGWWPIYRETPWLFELGVGDADADFLYTDPSGDTNARIVEAGDGHPSYAVDAAGGTSGSIEYDLVPSDDPLGRGMPPAILIASEDYPMPDYVANPGDTGTTVLLSGSSIGSHDFANGAYGTVGDTSNFDNTTDGSRQQTTVELRLTTSLHTAWDFVEVNEDGETNDFLAPLVMGEAPDVPVTFDQPEDITYAEMQSGVAHPAIDVATASFAVNADNVAAQQGSSTNANPGGS